jgi:hypothetical protein
MPSRSTPIVIDGQVVGIACSRGPDRRCKCGRRMTRLCDFALSGKKAGKTCDAPLCDSCAVRVGPDRDLCGAHAAHEKKTAEGA